MHRTALLVRTLSGWLLIECCPFVSDDAVAEIKSRAAASGLPFLGIALSHPHWFVIIINWKAAH